MKKCPVCAVEVEDAAPFCNICGVNLAGAKDVGPSQVETPVAKKEDSSKVSSVSSVPPVSTGRNKPSFYLPALQFLLAVALLGLVLYYTTLEFFQPAMSKRCCSQTFGSFSFSQRHHVPNPATPS